MTSGIRQVHMVFVDGEISNRAGGPPSFVWHLQRGLAKLNTPLQVTFISNPSQGGSAQPSRYRSLMEFLRKSSPSLWRLWKSYGPTKLRQHRRELRSLQPSQYYLATDLADKLIRSKPSTIYCQDVLEALRIHNSLLRAGCRKDIHLLLTNHSPTMPGIERVEHFQDQGLSKRLAAEIRRAELAIDEYAIRNVDSVVFPCPEAMEPYFSTYDGFADLVRDTDVRYLLTGIEDMSVQEPVMPDMIAAIPVSGKDRTYCFVGRHLRMKGYDLLAETFPTFLDRSAAKLYVAGTEWPLSAPRHDRWVELGFTREARRLISRCDFFILPNRRTFFDLVALEVLALGKPILASNTGGNRLLGRMSDGVRLFEPTREGLETVLDETTSWSREEIKHRGKLNRACYEENFTSARFASDYLDLVGKISRPVEAVE